MAPPSPEVPPSEGPQPVSPWSERKGKGLFWCLLFAPALLGLIVLATATMVDLNSPAGFIAGGVLAFGICVYCGIWMASGFQLSKPGRVFAGLGLSLAFFCLNGIVFFAGCFAAFTTF